MVVQATTPREERRRATVLFADLTGFTSLSEQLDPEDVKTLAHRCTERLSEEVRRFGGTVINIAGDQVVAAFGAPVAHEDDAERAVRAALAMRDCPLQDNASRPIQIHLGVNTGEVMAGLIGPEEHQGYTVMGDTTNVAARLMSAAPAGSVLVGEETWRATRGVIRYRDLAPVLAKGKQQPVRAWEALEPLAAPKSRPLGSAPLVGRDEELGILAATWLRVVRERRPHLVSVLGEPGIGKSRLVSEFEKRFCRDAVVLHGRCLPYGEAFAYGALTMVLKEAAEVAAGASPEAARSRLEATVRGVVPSDPEAGTQGGGREVSQHLALLSGLDGPEDRFEQPPDQRTLHASLRRFLEAFAGQRPLCLIFEDIQWAEAALLELIEYIAARAKPVPLLLITQARPQLLEKRPAWAQGVKGFTSVPLEALSPTSGGELIRALCRERGLAESAAEQIGRGAGGNPLFAEELVAMLSERPRGGGLPLAVTALIAARLDLLPAAERDLLELAAVFGKTFWTGGLRSLGAPRELGEHLEALEQKDLIRAQARSQFSNNREYAFKHDLICDVAYERLPRSRRRALHEYVADWMECAAGEHLDSYSDQLTYHALRAGQEQRALNYLEKAAERAFRAALYQQAAAFLEQAIGIATRLGSGRNLVALRSLRGRALEMTLKWPEARSEFEAALAGTGEERSAQRAELLLEVAWMSFWLHDCSKLRPHANEALALAEEANRPDLAAGALYQLAAAENADGETRAGVELCRRAIARVGRPHVPHHTHLPTILFYLVGEYQEAIDLGYQALEYARERQDLAEVLRILPHVGLALSGKGRYADAQGALHEARRLGQSGELWSMHARVVAVTAGFHLDVFDFPGNEALAMEARELAKAANFPASVCSAGIDLLINFARRHDAGRAEALIDEVREEIQRTRGFHLAQWRLRLAQAEAEIALARGDWSEAVSLAADSLELSRKGGRPKYEIAALETRGKALAALGRKQEAVTDLKAAVDLARPFGDPALFVRAASGLLATDGNDALLAEARGAAHRALGALPDEELRRRFAAAEPVQALGSLG
jgi:class 3 adenylate cyclase/tetratricopeptide (TPR) repeat protein